MPKLSWSSALVVLMLPLGLAACGNGDDTPASGAGEAQEESQDQSQETTQVDASATSEDPSGDDSDADLDATLDAEDPGSDRLVTEERSAEDGTQDGLTTIGQEEVAADTDTLGESPADTLEEGEALPGETSRDDVDALIEETERRFEEASRNIDEQFKAAEQAPMELEPMDSSTDPMSSEDPLDEFGDASTLNEESLPDGATDVDAFLEEQERRFEEAERRLEEQFEEVEQGNSNMELEPIGNGTTLEEGP